MRFLSTIFLFVALIISWPTHSANDDGASDLGVDYAFLTLMALSPDFSAANYTIDNSDGTQVDIVIGRFPYHLELSNTKISKTELEIAVAHQTTEEVIQTFPAPDENIDAEWDTTGFSIGLLYEYKLYDHIHFTPSIRVGAAKLKNHTVYNGVQTNLIKDLFDGTIFNWEANTALVNIGLGYSFQWKLLDRDSSVKANLYHILVDSYNESNDAVSFSESANLFAINADMIFPTDITVHESRIDLILLLGGNSFLGENRRTLGHTTSYNAGIGAELPLKWNQKTVGHLRLSGQVLWADNMNGWRITIGYNPD